MKDTLGLIPQVFYDFIGRVAPGAAMLALAASFLLSTSDVRRIASVLQELPGTVLGLLLLMCFLAAYLVGFVLGALGSVIEDRGKQPSFNQIRQTSPFADIQLDDLPFVYDYILINNPAAGARLAKLRAESHMCGALLVGSAVLIVIYALAHQGHIVAGDWFVVLALVGVAVAAYLFQQHLRTRAWRLQINCWLILKAQHFR